MPKYDLSTYKAISNAAEQAKKHAGAEPNQGSYNAAWLHGYASALKDVKEQLREYENLVNVVLNYLAEHNDDNDLYNMLYGGMDLSHEEISLLGFDIPQCYEPRPEKETVDLNSNVNDWYQNAFPDDTAGPYIREDTTFSDILICLNANADIYKALGVGDSIVRERVFTELADILGIQHEEVYQKYLHGADAPQLGAPVALDISKVDPSRFTKNTNAILCFDSFECEELVCVDLCYDNSEELQEPDVECLFVKPLTEANVHEARNLLVKLHDVYHIPVLEEPSQYSQEKNLSLDEKIQVAAARSSNPVPVLPENPKDFEPDL